MKRSNSLQALKWVDSALTRKKAKPSKVFLSEKQYAEGVEKQKACPKPKKDSSVRARLKKRDIERCFARSVALSKKEAGQCDSEKTPGGGSSDAIDKILEKHGKGDTPGKSVHTRSLAKDMVRNYEMGSYDLTRRECTAGGGICDIEDAVQKKIYETLSAALADANAKKTDHEWGWYDRFSRGRDKRITGGNWFSEGTIPDMVAEPFPKKVCADDLYFFQITSGYSVSEGDLYLNFFCLNSDGQTDLVRITGFDPCFAVRVDGYETKVDDMIDLLEEELKRAIEAKIGPSRQRVYSQGGGGMSWKKSDLALMSEHGKLQKVVKDYYMVDGCELQERDTKFKGVFLVVHLAHPQLIPMAKDILTHPRGCAPGPEDKKFGRVTVGRWLPEDMMPPAIRAADPGRGPSFLVYEANVDFGVVFMAHSGLTPASWMKVCGRKWREVLPGAREDGLPARISCCDREHVVDHRDIEMADVEVKNFVPVMRIVSFDIEALPPGHFPTPKDSPVLVVVFHVVDRGIRVNWEHEYVFNLGYLKSWHPQGTTVFCYDFNDEKRMLEDVHAFFGAVSAQIITGYNINRFDLYFLDKRHKALGCSGSFMDFAYVPGCAAYTREKKTRTNQVVANVTAQGIFVYDMLLHAYEYFFSDDNTLGYISAKVLSGTTKEEFTYDQIESSMSSDMGREVMARYCGMDARLPYLMMDKLSVVKSNIQMARTYAVNMQDIIDKGTQFKVMGRLLQTCKDKKKSGRDTTVFIPTLTRKKKTNIKYKGATVLTPVQGYYGGGVAKMQWDSFPKNSRAYILHSRAVKGVKAPTPSADAAKTKAPVGGVEDTAEARGAAKIRAPARAQGAPSPATKERVLPPPNTGERDATAIPYDLLPQNRKVLVEQLLEKVAWSKARANVKEFVKDTVSCLKRGEVSWAEFYSKVYPVALRLLRAGVITLDFEGLYPSIYMANNFCYSTRITRENADAMGYVEGVHYDPYYDIDYIDDGKNIKYTMVPSPPLYLRASVLKGIIPKMEEDLKAARIAVKAEMKAVAIKIEERRLELKKPFMAQIDALKQLSNTAAPASGWKKGESPEEKLDHFIGTAVQPVYDSDMEILSLITLHKILDLLQNAIKTYMNGLYGYPGAEDSPLPDKVMATCITGEGRNMLCLCKWVAEHEFTEPKYPFMSLVAYGDTDSNMVALLGLEPRKDVLKAVGLLMAEAITKHFPNPKNLQFEKVYLNMVIGANKKMYAGRKVMVGVMEDVLEVKGMSFKKRGACEFERTVMKKALDMLVMQGDNEGAEEYVKDQLYRLVTGRVPPYNLVMTGALGKKIDDYPSMRPALGIAIKYEDPMNPTVEGDRMQWVHVRGAAGRSKSELVEDPEVAVAKNLPIDYMFYARKLLKQLNIIFGPVYGNDLNEVERVFMNGPHMKYSIDSYRHGASEVTTYRDMPHGSAVNYITKYLAPTALKCVVCNGVISGEKSRGDSCDLAYEEAGVRVRAHRRCAEKRCEVCGTKGVPLTPDLVCQACSSDAGVMSAHKNTKPWLLARGNNSLDLVTKKMQGELEHWKDETTVCLTQCMSCVKGSESRIDECGAKSCRWWRRGNHATVEFERTLYHMKNTGVAGLITARRAGQATGLKKRQHGASETPGGRVGKKKNVMK